MAAPAWATDLTAIYLDTAQPMAAPTYTTDLADSSTAIRLAD